MNYYIADLHLFHENVLKNGIFHERPFETLEEMHRTIMRNWNNAVTNGDTVFVVGDVAHKANSSDVAKYLAELKGHLVLITGNHDKVNDYCVRKQFDEIYNYKEIVDHIGGVAIPVVLSHYPIFSWNKQFGGAVHLYGHVHDNEDNVLYQEAIKKSNQHFAKRDGERHKAFRAYNVGCMMPYMNYTPRTLKEIICANT